MVYIEAMVWCPAAAAARRLINFISAVFWELTDCVICSEPFYCLVMMTVWKLYLGRCTMLLTFFKKNFVAMCVDDHFVVLCYYAPAQGALTGDAVWRLSRTSGRRAACAAGRLDGAYWLIGPGSAGLAQGCRCALPLQAWAGHIVAAARLQLVFRLLYFYAL